MAPLLRSIAYRADRCAHDVATRCFKTSHSRFSILPTPRAWWLLLYHRVPGSNIPVSRLGTNPPRIAAAQSGFPFLECQRSQAFDAMAIDSPTSWRIACSPFQCKRGVNQDARVRKPDDTPCFCGSRAAHAGLPIAQSPLRQKRAKSRFVETRLQARSRAPASAPAT